MVKPNIKSKDIKMCRICLLGISLKKDSYIHLIDYKNGEFFIEGYYHNKCYNERIRGNKKMQDMALRMLNKTNKLLKNSGIEDEYEVRI